MARKELSALNVHDDVEPVSGVTDETPRPMGLRAENIARTEMLDATRVAAHMVDKANADVLQDWVWFTHLDSVACRSCVGMHGQTFPLEDPGPLDHQSGRCARIPQTKSWAELGFPGIPEPESVLPDAEAWFAGLTEKRQRDILGARGYDAWKDGRYPMSAWSTRRENTAWRPSYAPSRAPLG